MDTPRFVVDELAAWDLHSNQVHVHQYTGSRENDAGVCRCVQVPDLPHLRIAPVADLQTRPKNTYLSKYDLYIHTYIHRLPTYINISFSFRQNIVDRQCSLQIFGLFGY